MTVDISQSLEQGLRRTLSRNGLLLIIAWTVVAGLSQIASITWLAALYSGWSVQPRLIGPTLAIPATYAGIGALFLYLVSFVVMAGALRTFVTETTHSIPRSHFTRNLGWMLLNLTVGFVLFYVAVMIGSIFFLLPGLFLLVSLYFWFVLVVVEGQNFYEAFGNSWSLVKGNRWTLAGLGLIVVVAGWLVMWVPTALAGLLPPWPALLLFGLSVSVFAVFSLATTARVYVQLTDDPTSTATKEAGAQGG